MPRGNPFKKSYRDSDTQITLFSDLAPPKVLVTSATCCKCGKALTEKDVKYELAEKGTIKTYCQGCAKEKLKPLENVQEM